jgi:hypothetical protein
MKTRRSLGVVNGRKLLEGAQPYEKFKAVLDAALAGRGA